MKSITYILFSSLVAILLASRVSFAAVGVSAEVEFELKVTQKIKSVIAPIDPNAIVITHVEFKKVNSVLPGTNTSTVNWFSPTDVEKIEDDDVKSVKVEVITSLDPFPAAIKKLAEDALSMSDKGSNKVTIEIKKMDAQTLEAVTSQIQYRAAENFQKVGVYLETMGDSLYKHVYIVVGIIIFSFALLSLLQGRRLLSFAKTALSEISFKLETKKEEDQDQSFKKPTKESGTTTVTLSGESIAPTSDDREVINDISEEGILALLSDCYWCEKDSYACWLWIRIKPKVKLNLTKAMPVLDAYAKFINNVEPKADNYHLDPVYLHPVPLHKYSQKDVSDLLKNSPTLWPYISTMRKEALAISIKDRVELAKDENRGIVPKLPEVESTFRDLPIALELGELGNDDEEYLFNHPKLLPNKQRYQFSSLVWVALLTKKDREKLISKVSAQSLAEIWKGPDVVLAKISEVLPEKKKALLEEYKTKVRPTKDSPVLDNLTDTALHILEMQEEIEAMLRTA